MALFGQERSVALVDLKTPRYSDSGERRLLPVGIDIPDSVKHIALLKDLAGARGSYAHTRAHRALYGQWKRAGRPMEPEKAKTAVHDCLELRDLVIEKLEAIA